MLFLQMNRLETKVNQLDTLHKRHIARPSFDEKNSEEDEIKAITKEVSEVKILHCDGLVEFKTKCFNSYRCSQIATIR